MACAVDKNVPIKSMEDANNRIQSWINVDELIKLSEQFPILYPDHIATMRCKFLVGKFSKEIMESNINSAYPLIHENVLKLYEKFLEINQDADFYRNMSVTDFVDRLLKKRAVMFLIGREESIFFTDIKEDFVKISPHIMQTKISADGTRRIYFGKGGWKNIGTADEEEPLTLENCLSYDEIELSAFLSVSSHTVFVNAGSRHNMSKYDDKRENIEENGVIIGLIGPQFKKKNIMEHRRMLYHKELTNNKMDKMMREFYECSFPKMQKFDNKTNFNVCAYKKRLSISFEMLLIEANSRARTINKKAFVHVVGIGLGAWRLFKGQNEIFIETFYESLEMLQKNLDAVSDIRFAYIDVPESRKIEKVGNIDVHFENADPHIQIGNDKLLIVSYAWDGNALPGNEFWKGQLNGSSDSAAGSSTQITELHNAHINKRVCGLNLRIASPEKGIILYEEYLKENKKETAKKNAEVDEILKTVEEKLSNINAFKSMEE